MAFLGLIKAFGPGCQGRSRGVAGLNLDCISRYIAYRGNGFAQLKTPTHDPFLVLERERCVQKFNFQFFLCTR